MTRAVRRNKWQCIKKMSRPLDNKDMLHHWQPRLTNNNQSRGVYVCWMVLQSQQTHDASLRCTRRDDDAARLRSDITLHEKITCMSYWLQGNPCITKWKFSTKKIVQNVMLWKWVIDNPLGALIFNLIPLEVIKKLIFYLVDDTLVLYHLECKSCVIS